MTAHDANLRVHQATVALQVAADAIRGLHEAQSPPDVLDTVREIEAALASVYRLHARLCPPSPDRGGVVHMGADATQMEAEAR